MVSVGDIWQGGESESCDNKGEIPPLTQLRNVTIIWVTVSQSEELQGGLTSQRTTVPFQYCYLIARGDGNEHGYFIQMSQFQCNHQTFR